MAAHIAPFILATLHRQTRAIVADLMKANGHLLLSAELVDTANVFCFTDVLATAIDHELSVENGIRN